MTSWLLDSGLPRVTSLLAGSTGNFQVLPTRPPLEGAHVYHLPSPSSLGARPVGHPPVSGPAVRSSATLMDQAPITAPAESSPPWWHCPGVEHDAYAHDTG